MGPSNHLSVRLLRSEGGGLMKLGFAMQTITSSTISAQVVEFYTDKKRAVV